MSATIFTSSTCTKPARSSKKPTKTCARWRSTATPSSSSAPRSRRRTAIKEAAQACEQYYVNHRWLGGMLTNWHTIQTRIDRLNQLDKMIEDGTMEKLPKKEQRPSERRAQQAGPHARRHPHHERSARSRFSSSTARKSTSPSTKRIVWRSPSSPSSTPTAIPTKSIYVIPGNDDAIRAVKLMASQMAEAINEGRGMAQSAHGAASPTPP